MIVLGIDPGLTGALAWLDDGQWLQVEDMPVVAKSAGRGKEVAAVHVAALLKGLPPDVVIVERQQPMRGQGVTSTYSIGRSMGIVEACAATLGLPCRLVAPAVWKRSQGLTGAEKGKSITVALQHFPGAAHMLQRKKDHGRAEALLIAEYGYRLSATDQVPF